MINDIIKQEEELHATLSTVKSLIEEHNVFPLKGMIEQIDKLLDRSEYALLNLRKWSINNHTGEANAQK